MVDMNNNIPEPSSNFVDRIDFTSIVNDPMQNLVDKEGKENLDQIQGDNGPIQIIMPEDQDDGDPDKQQNYQDQLLKTIVSDFTGDITRREAWRKPYEIYLWYPIYLAWVNGQTIAKTPTRSKIFVPLISQIINNGLPKMISFTSGTDALFDTVPADVKEAPIANNIKNLITDQLQKAKFSRKWATFMQQMLMYGTSYFHVSWKVEWKHVIQRVPKVTGQKVDPLTGINTDVTEYVEEKKYKIVGRRPEITVLDVLDVFPAQDHFSVDDQPGIFIRSFINQKKFEQVCDAPQPYFANKDATMKTGKSMKYQESRQFRKVARNEMATIQPEDIELMEYWGPYDLDGDGIDEEVQIVIANRQIVVRAVPNPYFEQTRPIFKSVFVENPLEWFGTGLVEPVLYTQNEINTLRRQGLDINNVSINPMWLVDSGGTVTLDKLFTKPNGVILTSDMNGVKRLDPVAINQNVYQNVQTLMAEAFNATVPPTLTGGLDDLKGGSSGGVGAVRTNVSQALEKFAVAAKHIEEEVLDPMLNFIYQLDLQYLNDAEDIRAFYGKLFPEPQLVTPAMITAQVNFKFNALSEMLGKDVKISQLLAFTNSAFFASLTPDAQQTIIKQLWEMYGFDPDQINVTGATQLPGVGGQIPLTSIVPGATPAAPAAPVAPPAPAGGGPSAGAAIAKSFQAGPAAPAPGKVNPIANQVINNPVAPITPPGPNASMGIR
jgi:hypothetical protein